MNSMLRRRIVSVSSIVGVCFLLCGCVERSVVFKVKKDGSGLVHFRNHTQNVSMFGSSQKSDDSKVPVQSKIDRAIEMMGEGVTLVSANESKNRSGWDGYDLVFAVADINKLNLTSQVDQILAEKDSDAEAAATDASDAGKTNESDNKTASLKVSYRFAFEDGQLKIRLHGLAEEAEASTGPAEGAIDPFAADPKSEATISASNAAFEQIAAKMLEDAQFGFFVEVEGTVTASNAKHRSKNLITLSRFKAGEIMKDKKAMAEMKAMSLTQKVPSRKVIAEMDQTINGFTFDAQEEIVVTFK